MKGTRRASQGRLCIFTRAPVRGAVKTRLARTLGDAAALAAHETLVESCLDGIAGLAPCRCELWIDALPEDRHALETIERWTRAHELVVHVQQGADLGARMYHALRARLVPGSPNVLIGTDCPDIDASYVARACELLESADVVIGPAEDGGYGLIGVKADHPGLFDSIRWSSSAVFGDTVERIDSLGLSLRLLPTIWDVDTADAWYRFERLRGRPASDR